MTVRHRASPSVVQYESRVAPPQVRSTPDYESVDAGLCWADWEDTAVDIERTREPAVAVLEDES